MHTTMSRRPDVGDLPTRADWPDMEYAMVDATIVKVHPHGQRRTTDLGVAFDGLTADKAFDSNHIIAELNECGAKIVILQHPGRACPLPLDKELYKWRHLIENFFCKPKEFKRIAMRADKTDRSLRRHNLSRRGRHQFATNLNRP